MGGRDVTLARGIPYYNAAKQVMYQSWLATKDPRRRNRVLFVGSMLLGAKLSELALYAALGSDRQKEDYKQLTPSELAGHIFIPHTNGVDWIRIRVPEQLTFIAEMVNQMALNVMDDDKGPGYDAADLAETATSFLPDQWNILNPIGAVVAWFPQATKPAIEVMFNKRTWPRIRPLVPLHMENESAAEQYTATTSAVGKWFGETLGLSPIKVDHLLLGYFGRGIGPVIGKPGAIDKLLNPYYRHSYLTAGRQFADFYEARDDVQALHADRSKKRQEFSREESMRLTKLYTHVTRAEKYLELYRKLDDPETPQGDRYRGVILEEVSWITGEIDAQGMPSSKGKDGVERGTATSRPGGGPWTMPSI
jgi:hypothetical protein